jgi:hypothetical protein
MFAEGEESGQQQRQQESCERQSTIMGSRAGGHGRTESGYKLRRHEDCWKRFKVPLAPKQKRDVFEKWAGLELAGDFWARRIGCLALMGEELESCV